VSNRIVSKIFRWKTLNRSHTIDVQFLQTFLALTSLWSSWRISF